MTLTSFEGSLKNTDHHPQQTGTGGVSCRPERIWTKQAGCRSQKGLRFQMRIYMFSIIIGCLQMALSFFLFGPWFFFWSPFKTPKRGPHDLSLCYHSCLCSVPSANSMHMFLERCPFHLQVIVYHCPFRVPSAKSNKEQNPILFQQQNNKNRTPFYFKKQ